MAEFELRSLQQILADMIASVSANSDISDINDGSVSLTILEASAGENANTYIQMLSLIRAFNLDNLTGTDLEERAYEYGLVRDPASASSGPVTISDTAFTKVETPFYSGLPGPNAGGTYVYGVANSGFTGSGTLILGRNSNNTEVVDFDSITDYTTYYKFNLNSGTPLTKDHGVDETIILSQGGDRLISAGTVVYAPQSDVSDQVNFSVQSDATIEDGDDSVTDVTVTALIAGSAGNVGVGRINSFQTLPFSTAVVTNTTRFSNGTDIQSDDELREEIKGLIQSLSRGIVQALLSAAQQVESTEQRNKVLSSKFREATDLNTLNYLYIDDGTGLEPIVHNKNYEIIVDEAAGTEQFLQLDPDSTPLLKAALVSRSESPYNIAAGETLTIAVNDVEETITFGGTTDFADPSSATAEEVAVAMNDRLTLIEARTTDDSSKVLIQAIATVNEKIKVVGGTANNALNFKEGVNVETLRLYKNDILLSKDGVTAYVETGNTSPFSIPNPSTLILVVDRKSANPQTVTFTTETTAEDIVATINDQLSGATATLVESDSKVRITSNNAVDADSYIEVTGGTANSTGGNPLDFPTDEVAGAANDFTLNRFIGQLELSEPLVAEDTITAGSYYTRAYAEAAAVGPYAVSTSEEIVYQVDDIVDSSVTTSNSTTNFRDSALSTPYSIDDHFVTCYVRFKDTTTTVAIRGEKKLISAYVASTGNITTAAFSSAPQVGDVYEIVRVATIPSNESLEAADMADFLNPLLIGANCYVRTRGSSDFLRIQTNSLDNDGAIRIHSATTAVGLGFTTDVTSTSQSSNYGYVESGNESDFTFGRGQTFIAILDNDPTNKTVSIEMDVDGTVDTSTSNVSFKDSTITTLFPDDDFFIGWRCRFTDATTTAAIRSEIRTVTAYNGTDGTFTVGSAFSGVPVVSDTFELIPTTSKNVQDAFRANGFSSLAVLADCLVSNNGRSVQISSSDIGSDGSVQVTGGTANDFTIAFTSDGTAGGQCNVANIDGLSINLDVTIDDDNSSPLDVTITNITAVGDEYTITFDSGGTDISAYITTQNAVIMPRNQFNFDTNPVEGVDGYKYHGGLIQQVQWTIDSKDTDYTDFPGVKAAGVQIEVAAPTVTFITVIVDVTTQSNTSLSAVKNAVKAAISEYINGLGVGQDVIRAQITKVVMQVSGITNCVVDSPAADQTIQDNEIARIRDSEIEVG